MCANDKNIISMKGGHIHSGDVIIEMCSNTKSIHKNSYDKKSENLNINSTTAAVIIK